MITRNFNLYLNAGHSVPLVINVNQYDSGEQWIFTLYNSDGTQYTPSTGAIVGIKSDGLGIINSGSVVDGKVVINETQQMTAAVGKAVFELLIDSQTHGTANFVVLVEEKPGNNADMSESDLSLLQEAIDATSPLPTGGSVGQVLTKTANGSTWSDAGTPTQAQVAEAVSDWADENITVTTGVVIDTSLSVAGAAADAKKTGDEISDLKSAIQQGGGFNAGVKSALLAMFQKCMLLEGGDVAYEALESALYPPANLAYITCEYTQTQTIYNTDSLDDLNRSDLVVTAHYDDMSTEVVSAYTLSGTLTTGTSTITVSYGGKTATFNVTVSRNLDYTEDALADAVWHDGYTYNQTTGTLAATTNGHYTEKFDAQECSYVLDLVDSSNNSAVLFIWDSEDNYLGSFNGNVGSTRLFLRGDRKYAISLTNANFTPNLTLLPQDKRATALPKFTIDLVSLVNSISQTGTATAFELDVTSLMGTLGDTSATKAAFLEIFNTASEIGVVGDYPNGYLSQVFTKLSVNGFVFSATYWSNKKYIQFAAKGINTLADMKQYITDNNISITFNGR